jgi:predicted aspartyl protease
MGSVVGSVNGAPLSTSLLGMTFLSRLQSFEFKGDTLIMRWKG